MQLFTLFISLFCFSCFGATLKVMNDFGGRVTSVTFNMDEKGITLIRPTNLMGKVSDRRVGVFYPINNAQTKKISQTVAKIVAKKNNNPKSHGESIFLNDVRIDSKSKEFKTLYQIATDLMTLDWKIQNGIAIETSQKVSYQDGKASEKKDFDPAVFCERTDREKLCYFDGLGPVAIE